MTFNAISLRRLASFPPFHAENPPSTSDQIGGKSGTLTLRNAPLHSEPTAASRSGARDKPLLVGLSTAGGKSYPKTPAAKAAGVRCNMEVGFGVHFVRTIFSL